MAGFLRSGHNCLQILISSVKVPESEANPMDIDNRAAIGIGVGVVAVILVVGVIVVLSVYFVRRKSPNRYVILCIVCICRLK